MGYIYLNAQNIPETLMRAEFKRFQNRGTCSPEGSVNSCLKFARRGSPKLRSTTHFPNRPAAAASATCRRQGRDNDRHPCAYPCIGHLMKAGRRKSASLNKRDGRRTALCCPSAPGACPEAPCPPLRRWHSGARPVRSRDACARTATGRCQCCPRT